jgi:hypothetical protein
LLPLVFADRAACQSPMASTMSVNDQGVSDTPSGTMRNG